MWHYFHATGQGADKILCSNRHLLNKPRLKNVEDCPLDPKHKLILLSANYSDDDLPEKVCVYMKEEGFHMVLTSVKVDYSYWSAATVLKRILPEGVEVPSAFETVGHIAHMNLREDVVPWKHIIGQVILDKNPKLLTVVNKLGSIDNEFRVFDMEVLAGQEGTETEVQQQGHRFQLDFRKVYWNSRLEREHSRLVSSFDPDHVILDVMAGIGPFAVPAAARGCVVYANDLNPDSHRYLCTNIQRNRVTAKAHAFCMDGAAFIRQAAARSLRPAVLPPAGKEDRRKLASQAPPPVEQRLPFHHVIMNLPATAVEFCSAFRAAFPATLWTADALPRVHVYAFAKGEEGEPELTERLERALGGPLDGPASFHKVRDVAPNKHMYCISFTPPAALALAHTDAGGGEDTSGGEAKRLKVTGTA